MIKFSIGIGNNIKVMVKIGGLTSGLVWHLLPSLLVGKILARKYQSFMQVPVMDYFIQLNFLCFTILDLFIVRGLNDMAGPTQEENKQILPNRQTRRHLESARGKKKIKKVLASFPANPEQKPKD